MVLRRNLHIPSDTPVRHPSEVEAEERPSFVLHLRGNTRDGQTKTEEPRDTVNTTDPDTNPDTNTNSNTGKNTGADTARTANGNPAPYRYPTGSKTGITKGIIMVYGGMIDKGFYVGGKGPANLSFEFCPLKYALSRDTIDFDTYLDQKMSKDPEIRSALFKGVPKSVEEKWKDSETMFKKGNIEGWKYKKALEEGTVTHMKCNAETGYKWVTLEPPPQPPWPRPGYGRILAPYALHFPTMAEGLMEKTMLTKEEQKKSLLGYMHQQASEHHPGYEDKFEFQYTDSIDEYMDHLPEYLKGQRPRTRKSTEKDVDLQELESQLKTFWGNKEFRV